jgi:predicted lipoprotein with Yx(FWY)xxD motif
MRKSGWTVAGAVSALLLLLTACGGSSSSSSAAAAGSTSQNAALSTTGSSSSSASSGSSSPASSANAKATGSTAAPKPHHTAGPQPSSDDGVTFPPVGTTVLVVQHSSLGWVMAKADGSVVYTYAKDSKGKAPTCTGSCASVWAPVTGSPKAGPADTFPGSFSLVTAANGQKVITYEGLPLYTFVGAPPLSTKGNGVGGVWHVIMLSESDVSS